MTDLQRLLAIEEIKTLFARRLRTMDEKQWHLYAALHTEDAVSETYGNVPVGGQPRASGANNAVVGASAIAAAIEHFMTAGDAPVTSVHHAQQPEIEFQSDDEATGIWAMEDHLWWRGPAGEEFLHGHGHYRERYRRVDGRWLIAYRTLTRLRVDHSPRFYDRLRPPGSDAA